MHNGKQYVLYIVCTLLFFIWVPVESAQRSAASVKNEALMYYRGRGVTQDYSKALDLYKTAAAMGDAEASFIAGGMYYTGKGTKKDPVKAFKYLDFAAQRGKTTPESSRALAEFFILGEVVPQNYLKAVKWFKGAAESGDPQSQLELGYLYFVGQGVEQDYGQAFAWFRRAAMLNLNMAQYNMGIMWYTGNGVAESSLQKAFAWFNIAASNQYAQAAPARDFLKSMMSARDLREAQQTASLLYREIQGSL